MNSSTNQKIVVGIDGSTAGAAAMRWAANQAELSGGELRLVYTWQPDSTAAMSGVTVPWLALESEARTQAAQWVADAIGANDTHGNPRKIEMVQGVPGPTLVELSNDATMLVVGTHVHRGLSRVLQGSVSHYCLTHATCVVVAVPQEAGLVSAGTGDDGATTTGS